MAVTRVDHVASAIRQRIGAGALAAGDRLPSVRQAAAQFGVAPATVVEAYDRLVLEGTARARPRAGFYVSERAAAPAAPSRRAPPRPAAIDPFWVSRQSLDAPADAEKPGCGWLPPDWMPQAAMQRALRDVARGDAALALYGTTSGDAALRRLIALRLAGDGLDCDPDQVLLTGSSTQAIDLICRLLLRPGDAVLVDDPCYFNFQALLAAHDARAVAVPYGLHGPDPDRFAAIVAQAQPRLYLTNSRVHNPTGGAPTLAVAHRLVTTAASHGLVIVEDDIFADFAPDMPTLAALDGLSAVIRIGSFSKTLSASLRCGYVAGRPEWIAALADLQLATAYGGPGPLATGVIAQVLASGQYRRHMATLRQRLVRERQRMTQRLARLGIAPAHVPAGGFALWCRLPAGQDSADLAVRCLEQGVILAPGNVFSPTQTAGDFMRFNVTQTSERALEVLAAAMRSA